MIDRKKMVKVAAYDKFWQELNYLRYPLEDKRVGWFRKASVIRKKRKNKPNEKIKKYHVIVAGGGPSGTLYASMLAQKGYSVLLVEKNEIHECGSTWNLSREEFDKLKATESLTDEQFEGLIEGEFKQGDFRLWNKKNSSPLITVDNISNWNALLDIIHGDTENLKTNLLASNLKDPNQLGKIKAIEDVKQLTVEMKKEIVDAFNTI